MAKKNAQQTEEQTIDATEDVSSLPADHPLRKAIEIRQADAARKAAMTPRERAREEGARLTNAALDRIINGGRNTIAGFLVRAGVKDQDSGASVLTDEERQKVVDALQDAVDRLQDIVSGSSEAKPGFTL